MDYLSSQNVDLKPQGGDIWQVNGVSIVSGLRDHPNGWDTPRRNTISKYKWCNTLEMALASSSGVFFNQTIDIGGSAAVANLYSNVSKTDEDLFQPLIS